ncbi:MAG: 5-formyltetrahydrofolate cyclo-ligase, partial [Citromicrobium sp.]|nr:5-formyltetrahydrofolate cyclo-ligase [Citromicrobium sp.]
MCVTKNDLRKQLRAKRREHVAALPDSMRTLVFMRPPAPLMEMIPDDATIGLYHAGSSEAPTAAYARYFFEQGHEISLPHFSAMNTRMQFRRFVDPHDESDLETGPFGIKQPTTATEEIVPDVLFVPLVGFTE